MMVNADEEAEAAEEYFVDQAAHLFLALTGIKSLPKQQKDRLNISTDFHK